MEEVRKLLVFTTHTPEMAGNEEHPLSLLEEMNFFNGLPVDEVKSIAGITDDSLNYTLTALRFSRKQMVFQNYMVKCPRKCGK